MIEVQGMTSNSRRPTELFEVHLRLVNLIYILLQFSAGCFTGNLLVNQIDSMD